MANLTATRKFAQKKSYSVSSDVLFTSDFDGTNALDLFSLPENALVTKVTVIAEIAGNTGLTLKVDVGSTTVLSAANVATAKSATTASPNSLTETGKLIKVTPNKAVSVGQFVVMVEYVEYTLGTGHFTNYVNA